MNFHFRKLLHTTLLLIFASLLLHGCAGHHRRPPPAEPAGPGQEQTLKPGPETIEEEPASPGEEESIGPKLKLQSGPAQTLYRDAEQAMQKGDYKRAEMLLERALRVEPKNGWYWHAMGRVKYEQGSYEQAIQFCLKSDNLAGRDPDLRRNNRLLLKKASSKTGDTRSK